MKIGLISPKSQFWGANKYFREYWHDNPNAATYRARWSGLSLGLLVVGALTPDKHEIEFIDENVDEIDFGIDYDLVGVSCMTQQATRAYAIADEFGKRKRKVVLGGIHPTLLPQEAKTHADSVVVGEVEYVWEKVLRDFEANRLQDFYKADKLVNMKDSPPPRFELLNPKTYPQIWIQASRGCPHDCEFCAASKIYGRKYRDKSSEQVIKEIEYAKSIFGNVWYAFADDNLFVNKSERRRLLEQLAPLNIRWSTQTDISIAEDDELLSLTYKSGCRALFIGFESLNGANLRNIDDRQWKHKHLHTYSEYIQKIQSHGIGVIGAFIVGFDEDDASTFATLTDFITTNHLWGIQVAIVTPFPGTRLRDRLQAEGRIAPSDWDNYTMFDVNFVPKKMTKDELERGVVQIYQKVTDKETGLETMKYFKNIHGKLQGRGV
jgi:radical SAM superfamily enzyme YgiQ (UPF0313 family)